MRPSPWLAFAALPWLPLLTACAPQGGAMVRPEVPASLLECLPQPAPPAVLRDDVDIAYFILDLAAAGADCRAKLERVRSLVNFREPE